MHDPAFRPGTVVGGKYRIERVLGEGGMGVVVEALHTDLHQPVALKFLHPHTLSGPTAIERFLREARAVARLKSEHVARVYDVGRDDSGNPYMVLELLEGVDLAKLLETRGALPPAEAVGYVLQACEALVEAHAAGIIHRDLKPHNLFLGRRPNGAPLVKVLDFGIAKDVGASGGGQLALTDSQAVMGSPFYMAPEHMRSARSADARSDIWSLGIILFELLAGRVPFEGETLTEVCIRVVSEPPLSLGALVPSLDPALIAVVMRCLEKESANRWQTVAELARALAPFARGQARDAERISWDAFDDTEVLQEAGVGSAPSLGTGSNGSSPRAGSHSYPGATELSSTHTTWNAEGAANGRRSRTLWPWLALAVVAAVALGGMFGVLSARKPPANDPSVASTAPADSAPLAPSVTSAEELRSDDREEEVSMVEATPEPAEDSPEAPVDPAASSIDELPAAAKKAPPRRTPVSRERARAPADAAGPSKPTIVSASASAPAKATAEVRPTAPATSKPAVPVPNEAPILHP